jgi:hypothetical protein
MKKTNWVLNTEDVNKGYLKETREYIYKLKADLMQKILSLPKSTTKIEINSIRYNQQNQTN